MHYREACTYRDSAYQRLIIAGAALQAIKDSLDFGDWLLWLKAHQEELGFNPRTAQRLLKLNATLTTHLTEEAQSAALRLVWGNEPVRAEEPVPADRLTTFSKWIETHSPADIPIADPVSVRQRIEQIRAWLNSLEVQLTLRRAA
jgi:hypothetical protein